MRRMIPVVDFAAYSLSVPEDQADTATLKHLAESICNVLKNTGFVYLKNHGVPQHVINNVMAVSRDFFLQPVSVKEKYAGSFGNHGWDSLEKENLNEKSLAADLKEAYNMRLTNTMMPIDIVPEFNTWFRQMFKQCEELGKRILDLISIGLDIDRTFLRNCHERMGQKGNRTTLRSLYYPPITNEIKEGQVRCGEHSDYGTITLLFQDDIGGLEVKPRGSDYYPAPPVQDTVLINIGDLMQRWTADQLVATKHRVLIPKEEIIRQKGRQSIAFFINPDDEVVIKCLDNSDKYEPISTFDYLNMRFKATYI